MARTQPTEVEYRARAERLDGLIDRAAELLDVDPEFIQYDIVRNQLCLPANLAEQLIEKAEAS